MNLLRVTQNGTARRLVETAVLVLLLGFVLYKKTAVAVHIENNGCRDLPIESDAVLTVPPIKLTADATGDNDIIITVLGVTKKISVPQGMSIHIDGMDVIGNYTTLPLGITKSHKVTFNCGN